MSKPGSISSIDNGMPLPPSSEGENTPFLNREAAQLRLQRTQEQKSRTQQELQTLERVRSTTPHMSPFEIDKKDKEIEGLKHQLDGMNLQIQQCLSQLRQAETTIKQQQITIHNQSKQIEKPRGRDAPNSGPIIPQFQNQSYAPAPPNFGHQLWNSSQAQPEAHQYGSAHRLPDHQRFGSARQGLGSQRHGFHQHQLGPPPAFNPQASFTPNQSFEQQTLNSTWDLASRNQSQQPHQSATGGPYDTSYHSSHPPQSTVQVTPLHRVNDVGSPESLRQPYPSTPSRQVIPANVGNNFHSGRSQRIVSNDPFVGTQGFLATPSSSGQRELTAQSAPPQSQPVNSFSQDSSFANSFQSTPLDSESGAMVSAYCPTVDQHVHDSIDNLFAMVKNYAFNHVNFVNTAGDTALPDELKQRVIKAGTLKTAFPIFKSPDTRYWLVTKIMLQWIIKHILKQTVFSGFDIKVDELIEGTRSTLYQSTPAQLRFLLLKNIGDHIKDITSSPQFDKYLDILVKNRTHQLYWLVRPMAHQPTMMDEQDMTEIVREAHRVAQLMFTGTDEYRFFFFEAGPPDCKYNPHHMRNVDPRYGNHDDEWLQRAHAAVRLCATPEVTVRKNNAQGTGQEGQVQKGRVLLAVRGDDYP